MTLKECKTQIINSVAENDIEGAIEKLSVYETNYPKDTDIITLKMNIALAQGDLVQGLELAKKAERVTPLDGDVYYNLGYVYELMGEYIMSYLYYDKAVALYKYTNESKVDELNLDEKIDCILNQVNDMMEYSDINIDRKSHYNDLIKAIIAMQRNDYGFAEKAYRSHEQIVGKYIQEDLLNRRFVGILHDQYEKKLQTISDNISNNFDLINMRGEFLRVSEGRQLDVSYETDEKDIECLVPIAGDESDTIHLFQYKGEEKYVIQHDDKLFGYYRVPNHTEIYSSKKSYYGRPIPLVSSPDRKRLVMSIFVDGLAGDTLQGEDFASRMPNTYRFFSKGAICDNAYTCAEWTFPSIANIMSGLYTPEHSMLSDSIDLALPNDVPTLDEYYSEAGYYTGKLSGNWRIIPAYGYSRGVDRYVYQHAKAGYKIEDVIGDTIDHLEAFKETDQYLWISIGDLHDIGDGDEMPINIQTHIPLDIRIVEEKGKTSVKQEYSANKSEQFVQYLRHMDLWLEVLYRYIEDNYRDEEIVISLFADHGQGFLVPGDKHFFSKERARVAFMFRGSGAEGIGRTQELISTVDYGKILRKLSGVKEYDVISDAQLPKVFGGECEREYTISESIHPKDPYQAALHGKNEIFYFVNPEPVRCDGKFHLRNYTCWLEDWNGNRIEDDVKLHHYLDIIKDHIATLLIYDEQNMSSEGD